MAQKKDHLTKYGLEFAKRGITITHVKKMQICLSTFSSYIRTHIRSKLMQYFWHLMHKLNVKCVPCLFFPAFVSNQQFNSKLLHISTIFAPREKLLLFFSIKSPKCNCIRTFIIHTHMSLIKSKKRPLFALSIYNVHTQGKREHF